MEDDQNIEASDDFGNSFDAIFNEFGTSMVALQTQDLNGSEQALIKAKAIYRTISIGTEENENILFKIPVNYIEITTRLLRSIFYSFDERFKKSLEELEAAKRICDEVNLSFGLISRDFIEEEGLSNLVDIFRYMFFFFERIILTTREITQSNVLKNEGKYTDDIKLLRNASH